MTTDTVGGVWTFTRELAGGLLACECDVALISFGRAPSFEQQRWVEETKTRFCEKFRFVCSDSPLEWMQDNDRAFCAPSRSIDNVASEFKPDVIHANQFCFGALVVPVPKLITAHSDVFSWAEACRDNALPASEWLRRYRELVQKGLDGATAITAPTRAVLTGLSRHFALREDAGCVVSNGRSIPHIPIAERRLQAVTAGRAWDEAKNFAVFEDIVASMPIMIAGERCFEGEVSTSLGRGLHHFGSLAENDLLALFAESAIYICASKYEPFGLAPLEAALCGCAILASDLDSLREVWGDAALYFTDAASLSQLLARVSEDEKHLREVQARCYAHAQSYSRERMVSAYAALYRQMLEGGSC